MLNCLFILKPGAVNSNKHKNEALMGLLVGWMHTRYGQVRISLQTEALREITVVTTTEKGAAFGFQQTHQYYQNHSNFTKGLDQTQKSKKVY